MATIAKTQGRNHRVCVIHGANPLVLEDMIVMRFARLHDALTSLPPNGHGGALIVFATMVRAGAVRPHTVALTVCRIPRSV